MHEPAATRSASAGNLAHETDIQHSNAAKADHAVQNQREGVLMVRFVDGRGFAFIPRDVVAQPKAFGLAAGLLEPAHDVDSEDERYRAAMLQHLMVVAARGALLKSQGISPTAFVEQFEGRGLGVDRVRRVFRGETMAQLTDLMFWAHHFPDVADAVSALFAPRSVAPQPTSLLSDAFPAPEESRVLREPRREDPSLRERQLAVLRAEVAAHKGKPDAPAARRTPPHPFS
ncbi:hypothetical protein [Microbacterium sp. TPU 3598]|uniref:hypothetical protein n=1 Tax=Microbacterium sp. TPU 3598 TaxID=1938334 RepID=UPI0012FD9D71|nr:hypothetical protein [Microbacterium sp. TPU 3598]